MPLATADLPEDIAALRAFALACQGELKAAQLAVQVKAPEIEKLRFQIAKLRRMQFGRSSERITRQIEQLELQLEGLETGEAEDIAGMEADEPTTPIPQRTKPKRKPLPDHLPRHEVLYDPKASGNCICPACGGGMGKLGEDATPPRCWTTCRGTSRSSAMFGQNMPARRAMLLPRRRHRRCQRRAVAQPPPCWRICWSRNTATLCRSTANARFTRARGWSLSAPPCAIGSGKRPGYWRQLSWRSARTCLRQKRFTVTTQRSQCWRRGWGEPRPGDYGFMCVMIGRSAAPPRRRPPAERAMRTIAITGKISYFWALMPAANAAMMYTLL